MKTLPLLVVVFIAIVGLGSVYSETTQKSNLRENGQKETTQQANGPKETTQQANGPKETTQKDNLRQNEPKDNTLYPFGLKQGDKTISKKDGGCSPKQNLQLEFKFFGKSYKDVYVCEHAVLSFGIPVTHFKPDKLQLTAGKVFFALFWQEIKMSLVEEVYYRQTEDPTFLKRITDDMNKHLPNLHYKARWAFCVTRVVNHAPSGQMKEMFQAVLTTDGRNYYVILNYQMSIVFDGTSVQAGSNSDHYTHYFSPAGHKSQKLLEITSNLNYPGPSIIELNEFKAPGGCIFEGKFAKEGEPFWKDSACSTKCLCQKYKAACVPEACPPSSTCEVLGSFFTCKVKKEPEQNSESASEEMCG